MSNALSLLSNVTCEVERKPPRVMLYGVEGIGKSSWAADAQNSGLNPVFIPTEDGVRQIKCAKLPLAKTADRVTSYLDALINEKHEYKMVVVDTIDWLERLIWEVACSKFGVNNLAEVPYGKGFGHAEGLWQPYLKMFDQLVDKGIAVVLLAHAGIQKIEDPDMSTYDNFAPKLHTNSKGMGIMQTFSEWADCLLFAKYERYIAKESEGFNRERTLSTGLGRRMIYTQKSASFNAKNRYSLPAEIEMSNNDNTGPDFGKFWNAFCNSPVFK